MRIQVMLSKDQNINFRLNYFDKNFTTVEFHMCTMDTQQEYSSKPLKHGIVKHILVFKR